MSPHEPVDMEEDPETQLQVDEDDEEVQLNENEDVPMDSDEEQEEEFEFQNDSIAHFDKHTDSIFCIARHPLNGDIVATGAGDDTAYIFSTVGAAPRTSPTNQEREGLQPIQHLEGHTDSVAAIAFTLPSGEFLLTGGLDGKVRAYSVEASSGQAKVEFVTEAAEFGEINWLLPSPHADHHNVFAVGDSAGTVWVYQIENGSMNFLQTYYLHTTSCTAGAWSPNGKLLATVSEESSLYVFDPFGEVQGGSSASGQAIVSLTARDQRFAVDGGLYSVAVAPSGAFCAVGGADGFIRVVSLPLAPQGAGSKKTQSSTSGSQAGQILASLQAQGGGIETLSFSPAPSNLLVAGSVDGSIALFDHAHRFALRRHIQGAHGEEAVVQVAFAANGPEPWALYSCGSDGVLRKWDTRGGTAAANMGLLQEWKGHQPGAEGGGILGFVYGNEKLVTAGDDGVSLVFAA